MSVKIEVKGFEELQKKLEMLKDGLTLEALQRCAKEIELEAKQLPAPEVSQEIRDSIHVDVLEVEPRKFQVRAGAKKEALPLLATSTRDKLVHMPTTSRAIFKAFLTQIEKNLS